MLSNPTFLGIIISALIAVTSWFIIAGLNRKHEVKKRLLDLRIKTFFDLQRLFDLLLVLWEKNSQEGNELMKTIKYQLRACGSKEENDRWQELINALQKWKENQDNQDAFKKANDEFRNAQSLFYGNLRKEFGLKPFKLFDN